MTENASGPTFSTDPAAAEYDAAFAALPSETSADDEVVKAVTDDTRPGATAEQVPEPADNVPDEPVDHAVFAAETDPSTVTPADDEPEAAEVVADEVAAFKATDGTTEPVAVETPEQWARTAPLPTSATDNESLAELHAKVDRLLADLDSVRDLITQVGPVIEDLIPTIDALVEEAKSKGITGFLPLLFTLIKSR